MAGSVKAPGCGEYNRKNALARQIYTIRRGRLLPHYHIWGWKGYCGVIRKKHGDEVPMAFSAVAAKAAEGSTSLRIFEADRKSQRVLEGASSLALFRARQRADPKTKNRQVFC